MHVAHANVTVSALKSCQKSRILRILEVARAMSHLVHRLGDWHVPDDFFFLRAAKCDREQFLRMQTS